MRKNDKRRLLEKQTREMIMIKPSKELVKKMMNRIMSDVYADKSTEKLEDTLKELQADYDYYNSPGYLEKYLSKETNEDREREIQIDLNVMEYQMITQELERRIQVIGDRSQVTTETL